MSVGVADATDIGSAVNPPPAPGADGRWAGVLATGVAGLTPILAYLGNLGFAPLIAIAGLLYLPQLFRDRKPNLGLAILLGLVVWAVASMLWSIASPRHLDPKTGIESLTAVKLVLELALYGAFVAASLALSKAGGARASLVLAVGLATIAALFLLDAVLKGPIYLWIRAAAGQTTRPDLAQRDLARVAYVLVLLFWPAALRLQQTRFKPAAYVLAASIVIGSFVLGADAPLAALFVSTVLFVAVRFWGRPAILFLLAGVAVYFAAAPMILAGVASLKPLHPGQDDLRLMSWAIRLDIWRFAAERIAERPFWGWGLDASRMFSPAIPLHTHNAAVQLWLELGMVGAALASLFWFWLVSRIDLLEARDRSMAAAAAACAGAYLTIGGLSFGIWQEWWLALGALAAASCVALVAARRGEAASQTGDPAQVT